MTEYVSEQQRAWSSAVTHLTRREHSSKELQEKLRQSGFAADVIQQTIEQCLVQGFLSDERYSEMLVRTRVRQGYGRRRIQNELQEKGVNSSIIEQYLQGCEVDWQAQLRQVRDKKFGSTPPADFKEKSKQIRFLEYRGFAMAEIMALFDE